MRRFEHNDYPLDGGVRLLEASAGTGKTFALAHLVLRLITERNLRIEQLLVVTFTDAAAAELQDRIGRRLDLALQGLTQIENDQVPSDADPVLRAWLERHGADGNRRREIASCLLTALDGLEKADITTIHGFCHRTLRRLSLQSGAVMDPDLESDNADLCHEVAHDYWQQQVLSLDPEDVKGLQMAQLSPETLSEALRRLDGDSGVRIDPGNDPPDPNAPLKEQFESWIEQRWLSAKKQWQENGDELETALCAAAADWRSRGCSSNRTTPYSPKPRTQRASALSDWMRQAGLATPAGRPDDTQIARIRYGYVRKQPLLGGYFHPGTFSRVARACGEAQPRLPCPQTMEAIAALWDGPSEQVWRHALISGAAALKERRNRRGVIGFSGLLDALDPASQSEEQQQRWISELRRRYRVALIDEFQDTDPLQWRLLRTAFATGASHLLLMVGDPKQAIYRFRGGDLNTYREARQQADRIDALLDNYRTTPPLMLGLNQLMATGLEQSRLEVPALDAKSSAQPLAGPDGPEPLQVLNLPESGETSIASKTVLEDLLPRLVAGVSSELMHRHAELSPADLCVLVSRHRQAEAIRAQLAAIGLPSRLVSRGDVFNSAAAEALQRLLDSLASPANDGTLRLLACSALLQWSAHKLASAEADGGLDQLAQQVRNLADALPTLGLLGCLSQILAGETMAALTERGRFLGDLQQCARLVQDTIHRLGLDASSAADWLRRQRLQPEPSPSDERQPHSDHAEDAVAVVTVHRSKGLEYPVVICPYLWQMPQEAEGPLWRRSDGWIVAINRHWGCGRRAAEEEDAEIGAETERLAYVAMTRAVRQLILIDAQAGGHEHNPLKRWLATEPVGISRQLLDPEAPVKAWRRSVEPVALQLGPIPERSLDRIWGRSSYSAWSSSGGGNHAAARTDDPRTLEEGRDRDPISPVDAPPGSPSSDTIDHDKVQNERVPEDPASRMGPLSGFPRGPAAGDCLHRMLERVNFATAAADPGSAEVIAQELRRAGLEADLQASVQQGLARLLKVPLGGPLGALRLEQIAADRRRHELSFDLPIAHRGRAIQAHALAASFRIQPEHSFSGSYADRVASLSIHSRGFLTGSIDLMFSDTNNPQTSRWWVADWKSNWLGERDGDGQVLACGPCHYQREALLEEMVKHHYPLQAHLYMVALHRFLEWRLPGYDPQRNLGGYVYVFLRGVPEPEQLSAPAAPEFTPGILVEPAPVERILHLNQQLEGVIP